MNIDEKIMSIVSYAAREGIKITEMELRPLTFEHLTGSLDSSEYHFIGALGSVLIKKGEK